ncbi:MAG: 4Fe-4S dicluster domain-containing protein [Roseobacter sp.]
MCYSPGTLSVRSSRTQTSTQRPPGALGANRFEETWTQCSDCMAVCPQNAILADQTGYPVLDETATCLSCGLCADVCMHGAIELTDATSAGLALVMALESREAVRR